MIGLRSRQKPAEVGLECINYQDVCDQAYQGYYDIQSSQLLCVCSDISIVMFVWLHFDFAQMFSDFRLLNNS